MSDRLQCYEQFRKNVPAVTFAQAIDFTPCYSLWPVALLAPKAELLTTCNGSKVRDLNTVSLMF